MPWDILICILLVLNNHFYTYLIIVFAKILR
uniref:Uncharacterized protein n=1 Tax=Heterorhabditis bacteriophora TaxID=37862 RepID=A0A1I7WEF2_HETBA